jgi:adenylate cyclase class 2
MSNEEVEIVYTDIDVEDIENRLQKIGAEKAEDILYRIVVFDYPDLRLEKNYSWVRLRSRGDKTTLTYKERQGVNKGNGKNEDLGMKEVEVEVSDFEQTKEFLLSTGFMIKLEQDKERTRWRKDDVTFDIDYWPMLKPYLEIEADNMQKIDLAIKELKLDINKKRIINNWEIYKENGINLGEYQIMTFGKQVKK